MEEIYTIWKGEYSDATVIGVAYDTEIADAFAKVHKGYVMTAPIITDRTFITRANNMAFRKRYYFENIDIGLVHSYDEDVETDDTTARVEKGYTGLWVDVYNETDEIKAYKIASDTLMKYLSEKILEG